jgi:hypothetical protein
VAAASGVYFTGRSLDATRVQNETIEQGQLTDRFTKAVDQLDRAGPEHLQARLGAIYALERLARDSPRDQPTVVEVLAAFIRATAPRAGPKSVTNGARECADEITLDVRAALAVLGRRNATHDDPAAWIDLSYTCLVKADLSNAAFTRTIFDHSDLSYALFRGANLSEARLFGTNCKEAYFVKAILTHAVIEYADLSDAEFSGADLSHATLAFSDLRNSWFGAASDTRPLAPESDRRLPAADFRGARLDNLFLQGTNLIGVTRDKETVVNGGSTDEHTHGIWW